MDELFRRQTEGDQCTGTTKCDHAGGQAAIPSAPLCADRGGTTERLPHSAQRLLELVRLHEHYRSAFFGRLRRHGLVLGRLCDDHSLDGGIWRAALRCNTARWPDRERTGNGGRWGSPCQHKRISSSGKARPSDRRRGRGDSPRRHSCLTLARTRAELFAMQACSSALPWRKARRRPMELSAPCPRSVCFACRGVA
jgi:hypothetical protein